MKFKRGDVVLQYSSRYASVRFHIIVNNHKDDYYWCIDVGNATGSGWDLRPILLLFSNEMAPMIISDDMVSKAKLKYINKIKEEYFNTDRI